MAASPTLLIASLLFIAAGIFLIRRLMKQDDTPAAQQADSVLDDFVAALREFVPDANLDFNPDSDTIRLDGGERGTLFLGNMRKQVGEVGREDQRKRITDFVRLGVAGEDPEPDVIRSGLTLRPRTAEEMATRSLAMGDKFSPIVRARGDLFLDMMCDVGVAMRGMTQDLLEQADLDESAAFALAADNLRSITPTTPDALWEELEPGIWAMRAVDDYSAARMIAFWPDLPLPVTDVGTVHMPTQGTVLLIEGADPERQRRLMALGEEVAGIQRPLCMRLYGPSREGLVAMHEGPSAALANAIADFRAYDDQVDALSRLFEDAGEDVFVPKPMVLGPRDDDSDLPRIGCVFIGGGSLLPQVDALMLVEGDDIYEIAWDDAVRLIGTDRLQPYQGLLPVRYDLRGPLPDDIMSAIRDAATLQPKEANPS